MLKIFFPPRFALILLAVVTISQGCKKAAPRVTVSSQPMASNVSEVISVSRREDKVPDFSWKDSTGATVHYEEFKGKVTLINLWATWCGPCKKELPALVELSREYADKGVVIIGISSDRGSNIIEDVRAFVHENGLPYQIVISNDELEEAFGNIRALPTSFLVNGEGVVVQSFVGGRDKKFLASAIDAVTK